MGIEIHRAITPVAGAWDALADKVGAAPFMRPGWFAAWREAFTGSDLTIVAVRRRTRLVAIVPLIERRGAIRSPTNDHTPMFDILAADEAAATALATAVFARRPRSVSLQLVDPDATPTRAWLAAAAAAGYATRTELILNSPYIDTTCRWEEYERRIDTKMKSDLRRHRRRMDDAGQVTLDVHDGSVGLEALLKEGFEVEAAGWKSNAGTAIATHPTTLRFYTQIASWAAERGWLRLCFLRLNGRAIAFDCNLEAGGVYHALKGGYDEEFRRFAPGKVLMVEEIERVFERNIARFEFLGEDEPYKLKWASETRPRMLVQAFSPSVLGRVERLAYSHGRPLAKQTLAGVRCFRERRSQRPTAPRTQPRHTDDHGDHHSRVAELGRREGRVGPAERSIARSPRVRFAALEPPIAMSGPPPPIAVVQRLAGLFRRSLSRRPAVYRATRRAKVIGRFALRRPHEPDFRAVPALGLDGRLFLDVGANSGQSALSFRIFDRRSPIVSVEANPDLEADLRLVGRIVRGFSYVMCAACAEDGPVELRIPTFRGVDISGEASVLPEDGEEGWWSQQHLRGDHSDALSLRTVTVPGMRLDRLELAPGLIKIDVEGAAAMVVEGLWETIARHRPAILIEADGEIDTLVQRLAALDYLPFSWDDERGRFAPVHAQTQNIFFLMGKQDS